ncbi:MAG: Ca-activated chloride channel family protein [Paraglaciecola sp.]|jgi:Ca-activated chloride channel family protein
MQELSMFNISALEDFHFLRAEWLLALLPLLILIYAVRHLHKQQSGWQSVLAGHLYQHIITTKGAKKSKPPLNLLALGWVITVIALAGPTWERLPQPVYQLNTGKVVLIDMSLSMRATDIKPDRLSRAKYKAIDLVNEITEGETGLVVYAGDAFTISPLTSDAQNLTLLIPSLTPEIMPVAGSEPFLGMQTAISLLTNAGYKQGEIFWITDGVENNQLTELSELLNSSPFRLSILAVGTEEGAPIQMVGGDLMKDTNGAIVVPQLTVNNLKLLAKKGNGRYVTLQANDDDVRYLVDQTLLEREYSEEKNANEEADNFGDKWREMGPFLVLLLLPLAAYSFRRGILAVIMIGFILPGYSPSAYADWQENLWKTPDQQGMQAYKQNEYDTAASKFDDPLWQGTALYKNQNFEASLMAFQQSDSIEALYNQGNALAQLGKLDEAIAAYQRVLEKDLGHQDAKANKELLEQLKQQQEQEQSENQEGDNQESDNQEQSDDQQKSQDESQNEQAENGQQSDSEDSPTSESESNSESSDSSQSESEKSEQQKEQNKQQDEAEAEEQSAQEKSAQEQQEKAAQQAAMGEQEELTDEQKEQMQRMQNLLNRIPDDPAFLLKRKMQIEHQQRKRERVPTQLQRNW